MSCIYLIRNEVNGKWYVGQTVKTALQRFIQHRNAANRGDEAFLYDAMRKHGADKFSVKEICQCDEALLNDLEKHYVAFFGTYHPDGHGYNLTEGGEDWKRGRVLSAETKAKIGRGNKGKVRSAAQRIAHSVALTGRKQSPETIAKRAASNTGKKHRPLSEESRSRIAAAQKGKKASEATKLKMSQARKGVKLGPMPEATKLKLSIAKKRLFAESRAIQ